MFNFRLNTAEIVGSVFYGASFTVFRNGLRSRLVSVGLRGGSRLVWVGIFTCDDHPKGHFLGRRRPKFFNDSVCREASSKALKASVLINYTGTGH